MNGEALRRTGMTAPTRFSDVQNTKLSIAGMTCAACERHVLRALEGLSGVIHVSVDLDRSQAIVEHLPDYVDAQSFVAAVRDAGYEARVAVAVADTEPAGNAEASDMMCSCCGCCAGERATT
jgi:copper chaperone CopZ